ncbi:MAG: sulfatase [Paludibacter sp.]|nr:sulfatase [Paludibacter sp.]
MMKPQVSIIIALSLFSYSSGLVATESPNIIFILADDLGAVDVGYMKQKQVHTPNIDRLKEEGMCFTNAYAAAPVSSPTRASIITGKYPARLHLTCHIPGVGMQKYVASMNKGQKMTEADFVTSLPKNVPTIAQICKAKSYNTAFIGKWHLSGDGSQLTSDGVVDASSHPENYGFDINLGGCAYGQPASYFSPYKNATLPDGNKGEYLTDRLGNEAVEFIDDHHPDKTGQPFFLYLSTYTVHAPYQVPEETIRENNGNKYFAMIQKLDENVGKVMKKIDEANLRNRTIIIFYSDNGGIQTNLPFNGEKGDLLEGGIRVPLLIRWPEKIKPGSICHQPVSSIDFLPTIAEICGFKFKGTSTNDGISLLPLFSGTENKFKDRPLFWHFPHHRRNTDWAMCAAVREGDWKLIWKFDNNTVSLFNLRTDEYETTDLSGINKKKAQELLNKLKTWQKNVDAIMPVINPDYVLK